MDLGDCGCGIITMMQFLGEDNINTSFEQAQVVILPLPVEFSTSYGKGTAAGPEAILAASAFVELYDEELDLEIWRKGIHTLPAMEFPDKPAELMDTITDRVTALLQHDKFIAVLGGEHSISAAVYRAYQDRFDHLSVLQLDAHSDLRLEYENSPYSHAAAMRRIWEQNNKIVQLGVRAQCSEEREFIKQHKISIYYAHQLIKKGFSNALIKKLDKNVYLTIDVDFFDPAIMPSTGTPEPGGFCWYETLDFLRRVFQQRNVLGFDVVELSPIPALKHPDFMVAKLISKLIGFHFLEKDRR
jgi:N1-aminopropylagmatine ureohydrolase